MHSFLFLFVEAVAPANPEGFGFQVLFLCLVLLEFSFCFLHCLSVLWAAFPHLFWSHPAGWAFSSVAGNLQCSVTLLPAHVLGLPSTRWLRLLSDSLPATPLLSPTRRSMCFSPSIHLLIRDIDWVPLTSQLTRESHDEKANTAEDLLCPTKSFRCLSLLTLPAPRSAEPVPPSCTSATPSARWQRRFI